MVTRIVCWNIAKRHEPWRELVAMDADVALLQEAGQVPPDVAAKVETGDREYWDAHAWNSDWYSGRWKDLSDRWSKVVKLSDRVKVEWFKQIGPISEPLDDEAAVGPEVVALPGLHHAGYVAPADGDDSGGVQSADGDNADGIDPAQRDQANGVHAADGDDAH